MNDPGAGATDGPERADEIVRRRFGLVIHDHQRAGFERTLDAAAAALGFERRDDYLAALRDADDASTLVERLLCDVTVGESYFFRDAAQVEFLERAWIPSLIARGDRGERRVRVWSAGCSSGQEIYTVAMLLERHLPRPERWDVSLLGTDINPDALAAAAAGRYREWSFRAMPPWARARYFRASGREWLLSDRIRDMARFRYLNLADPRSGSHQPEIGKFDLILCRNVFIYFCREVVTATMRRFAGALRGEGVVLLGPADIVSEETGALELESWGRSHLYRHRTAPSPTPHRPAVPPPRRPPAETARAPASPCPVAEGRRDPDDLGAIDDLLRRGAWEAAASAADAWLSAHGESAVILERKARAQASLGRHASALAASERALALDPVNPHAHFIRGLTLVERGEAAAAEASLRKAIYLDRDFLEAHHQLGALLLRRGDRDGGLRCLRNALAIAQRASPAADRGGDGDAPCVLRVAMLRDELARLGAPGGAA